MIIWRDYKEELVRTSYNPNLFTSKKFKGMELEFCRPVVTREQIPALDMLLARGFDGWSDRPGHYTLAYSDLACDFILYHTDFTITVNPIGQISLVKIIKKQRQFDNYQDMDRAFNNINWANP